MASNFPTPIDITHDKDRTILIELSRIALAQFNADQVCLEPPLFVSYDDVVSISLLIDDQMIYILC
jgi:hypothetical protein